MEEKKEKTLPTNHNAIKPLAFSGNRSKAQAVGCVIIFKSQMHIDYISLHFLFRLSGPESPGKCVLGLTGIENEFSQSSSCLMAHAQKCICKVGPVMAHAFQITLTSSGFKSDSFQTWASQGSPASS